MNLKISNTVPYSPVLNNAAQSPKSAPKTSAPSSAVDRIELSLQAKETQAPQGDRFSPLEAVTDSAQREALMAQIQDWRQSHQLEVNWNAAVDPDGSIYAKSYMDSLACQCETQRAAVEAYYQEGHQENLRFSNPYNHLVEKYKFSGSPYFRGDMSQAQRSMAFRQEEALLRGGRVALNDPWALADLGGVPKGEDVEKTARDCAQSVIDGLIAAHKKATQAQN